MKVRGWDGWIEVCHGIGGTSSSDFGLKMVSGCVFFLPLLFCFSFNSLLIRTVCDSAFVGSVDVRVELRWFKVLKFRAVFVLSIVNDVHRN